MGVKHTVDLTRSEAEEKYVSLRMGEENSIFGAHYFLSFGAHYFLSFQRKMRAEAVLMSDTELEDALERLNDEAHDGEGFENYLIDADFPPHRGAQNE